MAITGILLLFLLWGLLPKHKMPVFHHREALIDLDWMEPINLSENQRRLDSLFGGDSRLETYIAWNGQQHYMLRNDNEKSPEQSKVYIRAIDSRSLDDFLKDLPRRLGGFPHVRYRILPPENLFQYIFGDRLPFLTVKLFTLGHNRLPPVDSLPSLKGKFHLPVNQIELQKALQINISAEKLILYDVPYRNLIAQLQAAFRNHYIDYLKTRRKYYPIVLSNPKKNLDRIWNNLFVTNRSGHFIPVRTLIEVQQVTRYKYIHGDRNTEFLRFDFPDMTDAVALMHGLRQKIRHDPLYNVRFSGRYFSRKSLFRELFVVIGISLLLLYFIMVAQFESFWQPIIILLEIPIDIGFGLLFLWLFGSSINLMALIGIVVMSGVVINDSILKLYTVNMLRKQGYDPEKAVRQAGLMRFKAILMTSLTTVLALLPFLFMQGLGAELQKPMALTVIGSMISGTFVSLYFLPLAYMWFVKKFSTETHPL